MRPVTFADTGRCRRELVRGAIGANAVVMPELQLAGSTVPPSPANMKPTLDVKHPRSWDLRLPKALGKRNPPTLSAELSTRCDSCARIFLPAFSCSKRPTTIAWRKRFFFRLSAQFNVLENYPARD